MLNAVSLLLAARHSLSALPIFESCLASSLEPSCTSESASGEGSRSRREASWFSHGDTSECRSESWWREEGGRVVGGVL